MEFLEFRCPQCDWHFLHEIRKCATISSTVSLCVIEEKREINRHKIHTTNEGLVDNYNCNQCGFILKKENQDKCQTFNDVEDFINRHKTED